MGKKLTLDETWEYCLAMWKWIDKKIKGGKLPRDMGKRWDYVSELKAEWCKKKGFTDIKHNCFFCMYVINCSAYIHCDGCPGYLVDKSFHCNKGLRGKYTWYKNPGEFYKKIVALNEKRKDKKK